MDRPQPAGRRLWAFRLVVLAGAFVASFALAEIVVRALGIAPVVHPIELDAPWGRFVSSENPRLQYVPRPGSGDVNRYGIRDRDYPLKKPDGVYRILVIGDSFAFGLCVDDLLDTFPKVLEATLSVRPRTDGRRVEVINLGVSGYDTEQEVEFLKEKGLALSPDLVIVSFCLNDYVDLSWELRRFRRHREFSRYQELARRIHGQAFQRSHLIRLLATRLPAQRESATDGEPDRVERGFAELRSLAAAHGFRVLVVVWPDLMGFDDYAHLDVHDKTFARTQAAGFGQLDLLEPFRQRMKGDPAPFRCEDGHPNERAHALAAELIAQHLNSSGTL